MSEKNRKYIAIDLKSFYASVECVDRGLNPLTANLVVADASRTEKTICLAVSPALKSYGIPGRPRLFEVVQRVKEVNSCRPAKDAIDFIIATPRMAKYMEVSTQIYNIYLKYVSPDDIHVYSVDEVFIDATDYLKLYQMNARELAQVMIKDVLNTTGITATAGIGTNLYLCKIAMDIVAKHIEADEDGVRIAELDEMSYRRQLWNHRPLTDFWRVGKGYAKKLAEVGIYTMGDIARCSLGSANDYYKEDLLYKLFGINAELLIDHAWGWEPCQISDIKSYKPENNSMGNGQVLQCPYTFDKAKIVIREMVDALALDLVDKGLVTNQIVLTVGYDIENLTDPERRKKYKGEVTKDNYGRSIPKHAHGTENLDRYTSSSSALLNAVTNLYERIVDKDLLIRRMSVAANKVIDEKTAKQEQSFKQLDIFSYCDSLNDDNGQDEKESERERHMQEAMLDIKKRYGKNAILRGSSFEEGATAKDRNRQIGGHKA